MDYQQTERAQLDSGNLDLIRLRFRSGVLERAFRTDYASRTLVQTRVSLALGAALFLVLGLLDSFFYPNNAGIILLIRVGASMSLLCSLVGSFHPRFKGLQQPWLFVQTLIGGVAVLLMIALGNLEVANTYYFGMMQVIVWGFNFSGLRFYPALSVSLLLLSAYAAVLGALYLASAKWLYTDLSNCVSMAVLVGFASYLIEWQRRVLFYQHCVIDRERLRHRQLAHYDQLTSLPNRLLFEQRLAEAMAYQDRRGDSFAVAFLDVDRFKPINDTFGHHAGDRALSVLASRLQSCVRERDMVARMGGDEFLVLIRDVRQPDDVTAVVQKILKAVTRPMNIAGETEASVSVCIDASVGVAFYPKDGGNANAFLRAADDAMYAVKRDGRNGYRFYASIGQTPADYLPSGDAELQ